MSICANRVVIVTGAGRGLGRAYALELAQQGACVVVNDLGVNPHGADAERGAARNPADEVVDQIKQMGGQAIANYDDVADWEGGHRLVQSALSQFGSLHAIVNNAGFLRDRMFVSATPEEWDAVMKVHLRGHFCTTRHAVDYWRAQHKAGNPMKAQIINTTSGAGLQGSIGQSAYSAAKAGIAGLTLVQATELNRYGITANAVAPQARTRMTEGAFGDKMSSSENGFDIFAPENTAPLISYLCSEYSEHVTGEVFELIGGRLSVASGWNDGPAEDISRRWTAEEISRTMGNLLAQKTQGKPVYGTV